MSVSGSGPSTYTDINGLARLKLQAQKPSEATLREVASQFEAMFIQMMLKSGRDAKLTEDGLFDNHESELYRDMFDKQVSLELAKSKGIGIGDMLVRQLRQGGALDAPDAAAAPEKVAPLQSAVAAPMKASSVATSEQAQWDVNGPEEFVQRVLPHARRAAAELGVRPEALIAQAALETGWGSAMPKHADGRPSFNLFGIKADASWNGERVVNKTLEFTADSGLTRQQAAFRSYDDVGAAFDDYARFVKTQPRYGKALEVAANHEAYVRELQEAGYATDPHYAQKVLRVMDRTTELVQQNVVATGAQRLNLAYAE